MKPLRCAFLAWAAALATATAQPYVVNTIAGHGKLAYSGEGSAASSVNLFAPNRAAFDAAGNLYFTEGYYHRVFKVSPSGTLTTVAGNGGDTFSGEGGQATAAATPSPQGVAVDAAGNIYVGTSARLCRISGGRLSAIAGTGASGYSGDRGPALSARIGTPQGIALDAAGNIFFSDAASHVVRRIGIDGTIATVAGTGTAGYSGDGLPGTSAMLNTPEGLALDNNGNLFIADTYNNRVRKLTPGGVITTLAGTGVPGTGGSGYANQSKLFHPGGVAVDANGNVLIADVTNSLLKMVDPSGNISTFPSVITSIGDVAVSPAGWLAAPDFLQHVVSRIVWNSTTATVNVAAGVVRSAALGDQGLATSAYFLDPWGIAADLSGNWYVADNGDQRIRRIGADKSIVTAVGTGLFGWSADGQAATASNIAQPRALAADAAGNVYFNSACQIRVLLRTGPQSGTLNTAVNSNDTCGNLGDGGTAADAQLQFPQGLALEPSGMLDIADTENNRIRRVNLATSAMSALAGNGQMGYAGNGTNALLANLNYPMGVAADSQGNVYVADSDNHRVRKITAAGIISDFAGTGVCNNPADGPATSSPLCYPTGVAVDQSGNVYIADSAYIRRVTTDGRLATIAGNGSLAMTGEGEPSLSTAIDPYYVALDSKGRVCFSDATNLRIRCLDAPPASPVSISGVSNNASGAPAITSGSWVSIYGTNLSATTRGWQTSDFSGNTLPTKLDGVSVTIDGRSAAVYYVSPGQLNVQAPGDSAIGAVQVVVANSWGSATATATLAQYSPGFFSLGKYVAAVHATDGAYVAPTGYFGPGAASRPAAPGETILLFGTGFGPTTPAVPAGQAFIGAAPLADVTQFHIAIGGVPAAVSFAGLVAAGEYQFNVVVPPLPDGDQPVAATIAGAATQAGLSLSVKN